MEDRIIPKHVQRRATHSLLYLSLFLIFMVFVVAVYRGGVHLVELEAEDVTIGELPAALVLSFMRMTVSYVASLLFAFILGLAAARTKLGERLIIPLLDILQSVPVVGFFPAAISFFIGITQGHRIGVELAAVFLIFTSQAWNLAFAVYETVKGLPTDQVDAVSSFGVGGSRRFWRLYAPACVPRLVYNSILSWSNGWFFLVACEIIAVGPVQYNLPGIGSFLARAAEQDELRLIAWGLLALTTLILILDFMVWRPASIWAERFRNEEGGLDDDPTPLKSLPQTLLSKLEFLGVPARQMWQALSYPFRFVLSEVLLPLLWDLPAAIISGLGRQVYLRFAMPAFDRWNRIVARARWLKAGLGWFIAGALTATALYFLVDWLRPPYPELLSEIPLAVLASTGRLVVAMLISLTWILPVVLFSWNRPKLRQTLTTIAQVGASLPAIALFPLFIVVAVRKLGGGMEIASILLLLTGMQWYVLFNCLSGAAIIPHDIAEATRSYGLSRVQTWRRLVLPAIRPALITGAITAWGGGWNALVVAEYVLFKDEVLSVNGIGALLNRAVFQLGDGRAISFCLVAMVGWILLLNTVFWRPVYESSIDRYKFR